MLTAPQDGAAAVAALDQEALRADCDGARATLAISARQMDRRLFSHKRTVKRRLYGTTRPGSLLKHMSPIKTDHWDVTLPDHLEIDLVSHSGRRRVYLYLGLRRHRHGLVERQAVMGKGQLGIVAALNISNMKNKDRFAHNLRSDFHMTQRTPAPVRFSDGLTGKMNPTKPCPG